MSDLVLPSAFSREKETARNTPDTPDTNDIIVREGATVSREVDVVIIGGGPGGIRTARMSAAAGLRTVMFEERDLGGTCVNRGCVPKKIMNIAAGVPARLQTFEDFGWSVASNNVVFDWTRLQTNTQAYIARARAHYKRTLVNELGITLVQRRAILEEAGLVRDSAGEAWRAARVVITSGTQPTRPNIEGADLLSVSDDVFTLPHQPRKVVVIGGGYIACEMATLFRGLGSEVTLLSRKPDLLRHFDVDIRRRFMEEVVMSGIDLRLSSNPVRVVRQLSHQPQEASPSYSAYSAPNGSQDDSQGARGARGAREYAARGNDGNDGNDGNLHITVAGPNGTDIIHADFVLAATGRRPQLPIHTKLHTAMRQTSEGYIIVDQHYATSVEGVYAIGDVVGILELAPVAIRQAQNMVRAWLGQHALPLDPTQVPRAVFAHPHIASVGLTEEQARAKYSTVDTRHIQQRPMISGIVRPPAGHTAHGRHFYKVVLAQTEDNQQRIVGLHFIGDESPEVLQSAALAVAHRMTLTDLAAVLPIHPTAAEELFLLS